MHIAICHIYTFSCWSSINVVFLFKVDLYTLRLSSKNSSNRKLWRHEASGFRTNHWHLNRGFIYVPLIYKDLYSSFEHAYVQWNLRTCDINKMQWSIQFRVWTSCKGRYGNSITLNANNIWSRTNDEIKMKIWHFVNSIWNGCEGYVYIISVRNMSAFLKRLNIFGGK